MPDALRVKPKRVVRALSSTNQATMTPAQKKTNLKTGLILASVALVFFIGFMVKMIFLNN